MAKKSRNILLINRRFQLKFCLYVCSWIFALSIFYPLVINDLFELMTNNMYPTIEVQTYIQDVQRKVLIYLFALQLAFLGVVFLISLFLSHKIAGPLYKLSMAMEMAARGDWNRTLRFRKHDYFQELAKKFNSMVLRLNEKSDLDNELVKESIQRIENAKEHVDQQGREYLEQAINDLQKLETIAEEAVDPEPVEEDEQQVQS